MNENEKLKFLFENHREEIARHRSIMFTVVKLITGIFLLMVGWLATQKISLNFDTKVMLSIFIILLILCGCWGIYVKNRSFLDNAKVINRINNKLGLFVIDNKTGESLYPEKWKLYGYKGKYLGIAFFVFMIISSGLLAMIMLIFK